MAYVKYYSRSQKCIVDEFLFAKYLKGATIFQCLEEYLEKHNIPISNITTVATDGAPAMVGSYRRLSTLLEEKVSDIRTVHGVLETPSCSQETHW